MPISKFPEYTYVELQSIETFITLFNLTTWCNAHLSVKLFDLMFSEYNVSLAIVFLRSNDKQTNNNIETIQLVLE